VWLFSDSIRRRLRGFLTYSFRLEFFKARFFSQGATK
jgi:hypothetical protein